MSHYRPILDWHDEGLHEWVRLSLPLMAGVSLVTADNWIIAHFASKIGGAVSLIQLRQAAVSRRRWRCWRRLPGAASMPFFASLWAKQSRFEFAGAVADSVSRVSCMGLLAASAMIALGKPAIDLVFTGGRFSASRCEPVRRLFCGVFDLAVPVVGAGHLLARILCGGQHVCAHGGGNNRDGGFAADLCLAFFTDYGAMGLAFASDIGIAMQTLAIAGLLHQRHMVSLASLDYRELGRMPGRGADRRGRYLDCVFVDGRWS